MADASAKAEASVFTFPPIVHLVWGVLLIAGNVFGNMMQVTSTQAWFLHEDSNWVPNLSLFGQFPAFFNGQMDPHQNVAFIASWGAQFVLMTTKIGLGYVQANTMQRYGNAAHISEHIVKAAKVRMGFWNGLSWLIILCDSILDWNFANTMGFWQQLLYVSVTFLTTFYSGTWGVQNIVAAFS